MATSTCCDPDTTNWGYDVVIAGMAAVNPVLLETGRPDELVDLAAVLHNFPGKAEEADPRRGLRPFATTRASMLR
jgi:hypothetical protein